MVYFLLKSLLPFLISHIMLNKDSSSFEINVDLPILFIIFIFLVAYADGTSIKLASFPGILLCAEYPIILSWCSLTNIVCNSIGIFKTLEYRPEKSATYPLFSLLIFVAELSGFIVTPKAWSCFEFFTISGNVLEYNFNPNLLSILESKSFKSSLKSTFCGFESWSKEDRFILVE